MIKTLLLICALDTPHADCSMATAEAVKRQSHAQHRTNDRLIVQRLKAAAAMLAADHRPVGHDYPRPA